MFKPIVAACGLLLSTPVFSQTLFTIGGDTVTVPQFRAAYLKNNTSDSAGALRSYLDLYIASRLKVKEARARGYDTLPQIASDLANLREQIMPAYLQDEAAVNRLTKEAALRSAKDIHLHHIFIAIRNGDTAAALQRAHGVLKKLEAGEDFNIVAKSASDDSAAKSTGGDAGFITVFTLPYAIENLIYNTPAGRIAPLHRSKNGYHIFKNGGERPAVGAVQAAQILIAVPPGAGAAAKMRSQKLADSLYGLLKKGAAFSQLAAQFSNDIISAEAEGRMLPFGTGDYDAAFESVVFALKDGELSKPFQTTHGYHIVKRLGHTPAATDTANAEAMQALRRRVEAGDRLAATQKALAQTILAKAHFQQQPFNEAALWAYTDSVLDGKQSGAATAIKTETPLFKLNGKSTTVNDWIAYARTSRYNSDGSGLIAYPQLWDGFIEAAALDHYKAHLEEYNEAFRRQLDEFREGNLFFEIMQREVWNKAQEDTAALQTFYKAHAQSYTWNESAGAVIFYCNDTASARLLRAQIQKTPGGWRALADKFSEKVAADSGRFEMSQLPNASNQPLQRGAITQPVINPGDNTASFALILKRYNQPAQRSFAEAKSLVVADYQAELEAAWIAALKQKYPVVINEAALAKL